MNDELKRVATAVLAFGLAGSVGAAEAEIELSRAGSRPVQKAPAANFTGQATVERLMAPTGAERASAGAVTFSPGARTAWHTHPLGQTLIVTSGIGRVQRWGGPVQEIRPGDVVKIPPGVKHWHGAAPDSAMTHMALQEALDGQTVDWLEQVSDAHYQVAPAGARSAATAVGIARDVFAKP